MLYGNAAAQRFHPLDVTFGDGFRVVEDPVQAVERNIAVHLFEHVQHAADGFVIGGMQAERPAVLDQMAHYALELIFRTFRQIRTRLEEILEVGGGEHQHFTGTVMTVKSVP